ncbi:MAG: ECF-type sigma factor [Thermoanaerobaculia bacterium]
MVDPDSDVTKLLQEWAGGDPAALDRLVPVVFDELRALARSHFARERRSHTLQPTALVSELFVRLLGRRNVQWENRTQFFKASSELMRRILVDYARRRQAVKRGGDVPKISLEDAPTLASLPDVDFVALYDALDALEREDPHRRELVELKFFFGWTHDEIAKHFGVSADTIKLRWAAAKARLYREMRRT